MIKKFGNPESLKTEPATLPVRLVQKGRSF
jgi:hypothetical protein